MGRADRLFRQLREQGTGSGGQAPGGLEVVSTSVDKAKEWVEEKGFDLSQISNFEKNYLKAQKMAAKGWTKRKNMPVIDTEDVRKLQARLKKGTVDIYRPFARDTDPGNPFPKGLSGLEADEFLKKGLKDGSKTDDRIDVRIVKKKVNELTPIQKQIYFDKAMGSTIKFGIEASIDFIASKSFFIISKDDYIIDGHHRYLSAMLINPSMKVNCLQIDLPLTMLLPLSLSYSDAIGKTRNL